jgi:hypothetical protein
MSARKKEKIFKKYKKNLAGEKKWLPLQSRLKRECVSRRFLKFIDNTERID